MTLDINTRNKINDCRDILVGKVPDPKAQIEQITIALIYKFMDDIDKEYVEKGLDRIYFKDEFEKYSWDKLMDPKKSSDEFFNLYISAIEDFQEKEKKEKDKILPEIFNKIFKDTFIPYKDPRTLKLFLKEIKHFNYSHSEKLGDAFEYLLSIMSSQGDAGQFRTPRHIIKFIVDVIKPKEKESVLDPSCGTCGFLIESYKHLNEKNIDYDFLSENYVGYDISYDMVRLGMVNMYFHKFANPKIIEYDTLTSEKHWEDRFDIIMANPPFMTPKGGIKPNDRFTIPANRSEILFLEYILEHLNKDGRSGVIVPEGIVFQDENAYREIRKKLIHEGLYCVVSLPKGVFNPYAAVKTSILLIDKTLKNNQEILFVKIANDGYHLGAQRSAIKENDLPTALEIIDKYKKEFVIDEVNSKLAHSVKKEEIIKNDYNLNGNRYESFEEYQGSWPLVEIGEVLFYEQPTKYIVENTSYKNEYKIPVLTAGKSFILGYTNEEKGIYENLPCIIFDDFTTEFKYVDFKFKVKSSAMKILKNDEKKTNLKFLFNIMKNIKINSSIHRRYWISEFSKKEIPLPPLEFQKKIVEKIEKEERKIEECKSLIEIFEKKIEKEMNKVWGRDE